MHIPNLKKFYILTTGILLLATARAEPFEATATVVFQGTSTLHGFEGTVDTAPFAATFREDPATGQLLLSATAMINVMEMTTHHKKRDKKMFKMLDQPNHGQITGVLDGVLLPQEGHSEATLHLKLHGIEQDVAATLSDWKRDGDHVSCRMEFSISLKSFNLKPPSVMGLIRVGDTVTVQCTLKGTVR